MVSKRNLETEKLEAIRSVVKVAEEQATEAADALYKSKMDAMKDCFAKEAIRVA